MRPQRRGMALAMADANEMRQPERLLANKYTGGEEFRYDGRHARLRMEPTKIVSWDFTNMARPS
jgi:hypothetical protein